jgi:hypothetical protein
MTGTATQPRPLMAVPISKPATPPKTAAAATRRTLIR